MLGAGIVGVSTALHLQKRGRSVVLIDRRGAGEETSYGNTGIIQREGVVPYPFPRNIGLMAQYALNLRTEANLHWTALPKIAPWLFRYWQASTPERLAPDRARGAAADRALRRGARGADGGGRHRRHDAAHGLSALLSLRDALRGRNHPRTRPERKTYGVTFEAVDARELAELRAAPERTERRRRVDAATGQRGGSRRRREGLCEAAPGARRALPAGRRALARAAARRLAGATTATGRSQAGAVVVALGPWSDDVLRPLGYRIPLGVKRGYHMHFKPEGNATLNRPVIDVAVRLCADTDGRRASASPPAPSSPCATRRRRPVQLDRVEPLAREIFPLGAARRGRAVARPPARACPTCCRSSAAAPRHEGLWLDFGHHHLG